MQWREARPVMRKLRSDESALQFVEASKEVLNIAVEMSTALMGRF